ncbi:MAG: type IV pilus inner membrane component PilO [Planctomycetota bacterium]|jgi:Tfp pilus assembly protein PilO
MLFGKKQQIAIFILAGMLVADFAMFGYLPLQNRMKAVKERQRVQTLAIAQASAASQQLPTAKEQLEQLQAAVVSYEQQVPAQRDLGAFLHRIADLMNEHNLGGQLVQPAEEISAGHLQCIPVSMQCTGRLTQIFKFFKSLQNLDRLVRIERVALTNEHDFSGEVSMQTRAVIYYRTDDGQG